MSDHPFTPSKCSELHETAQDIAACHVPLTCRACGEHRDKHMEGMFFDEPTLGLGLVEDIYSPSE